MFTQFASLGLDVLGESQFVGELALQIQGVSLQVSSGLIVSYSVFGLGLDCIVLCVWA